MLVTIVNAGANPVRVGYEQLRLVSPSGRRYSALPPFDIEGSAVVRVGTAYYPPTGFAYAPYMGPYFPGAPLYDGGFATNPLYWERFVPVMRTVDLPTFDMLRKALPEGVLEPGGRLSGFVYFEDVGPGVERVELRADFENADTGERIVRLGIPFKTG